MNHKYQKKIAVSLAVLMCTASLAACGGGKTAGSASAGTTSGAAATTSSSGATTSAATSSAKAPTTTTPGTTTTPATGSASTPASGATSTTQQTQQTQQPVAGVTGMDAENVMVGMSDTYNMPQKALEAAEGDTANMLLTDSSYHNTEKGETLYYMITTDASKKIIMANYNVMFDSPQEQSAAIKEASDYLGYAIALPYDTANADAARKWLTDNLSKTATNEIKTTIGDATFVLSGIWQDDGKVSTLALMVSRNGQ